MYVIDKRIVHHNETLNYLSILQSANVCPDRIKEQYVYHGQF